MDATRRRLRFVLAVDALLVVACLFGLEGLSRKAGLPVAWQPAPWFGGGRTLADDTPVVRAAAVATTSLRAGDRICSVSGQAVANLDEVEFVTDLAAIGDRVPVGVERDAARLEVEAVLVAAYNGFEVAVNGLVAAVFFGLAILVTVRRPDDRAALLFHASSAAFAILIAATWGPLRGAAAEVVFAVRVLFGAAYALAPALFLHFMLVFPRRADVRPRGGLAVLYLAALALAAGQAVTFSRALASGNVADFRVFRAWFNACGFFSAAGLCAAIVRLVYSYRTARDESERRRVRIVVPGFGFSVLAFVGLWIVPQRLTGQGLVPEALLNMAALVAPLAFAAAVVRHRALDIEQIVNRGTVYATVAAVLAALYTAVAGAIVSLLRLESRSSVLVAAGVAAVSGVLLFDPVRRRVQAVVDRTFFRVRYDAAAALRAIQSRIRDAIDEKELAEHVVEELDALLQPERVALLASASDTGELAILADRGDAAPAVRIDRSRLPREVAVSRAAVEAGDAMTPADSAVLQALGAAAVFPVAAADGPILGFLTVGKKRSGLRLTLEDVAVLQSVSQEVGRRVERLRLREELRVGRAESRRIEELARARSEFVSNVSHELRTPLTSVRMFAELLRTSDVPADRAGEYLSIIEGEADRLTRLIQDVLDFGRIERRVKEYRFQRVEADVAVCAALNVLRYAIELRGFRLTTSLGAPGVVIRADPDSLRQAVVNLVENAMKYSGDARDIGVNTRVSAGSLAIAVSDRGIGIAPEDQARVFEAFFRGGGEAVRQAAGAGLGLSIVRHIMEAHSGRVEVESAPGRGSTFTLVFPLGDADASHPGH